jgi:hypothetical protein
VALYQLAGTLLPRNVVFIRNTLSRSTPAFVQKKLPARPRCMGLAESGAYAWTNATSLHSSLVTGKVSGKVFAEHFNENDTGRIQ